MHSIKITPNLLFEYQCSSGKFIRLPNRKNRFGSENRIETFLPELECSRSRVTCYKYSITCQDDLLTVDNAQSHVTAFRPISEAARSWSDDNDTCYALTLLQWIVKWGFTGMLPNMTVVLRIFWRYPFPLLHVNAAFYRAMLCIRDTSHGPVSARLSVRPSVCLSVRHKSEFY